MNDYSKKWQAFIGICLLSFGCYLDYTVVNVALPVIQEELGASLTSLQWVMNIYFLVLCISATVMGRWGDLYGRRRLFYIGAGIFAFSSCLAGFSPTIHWLIFGRFLQGISAAIVLPLGPSLLPGVFPKEEHGRAIGWLGSLGGVALALGPLLGGVIVTYWGWRWIFFINIPLTLLGFVFCWNSVKESVSGLTSRSMDWQGMFSIAFAVGGIVLGLIHSATHGWRNPLTLIFLGIGIVASFILVIIEQNKEEPIIQFKDFLKLLFFSGALLSIISGMFSSVALFFEPLYLQIIRSQTPQMVGMILFSIPLAVLIIALLVGWLIQSFGLINTILIGLVLGSLSALMQTFFSVATPIWFMIITFLALGGMWAMGNTAAIIAAQTSVGAVRVSGATGTMVTTFNIGGSIGLAVGVMLYQTLSLHYAQNYGQLKNLAELLANPSQALHTKLDPLIHDFFNKAFIHGFKGASIFLFVICTVGLVSIFIWKFKEREC